MTYVLLLLIFFIVTILLSLKLTINKLSVKESYLYERRTIRWKYVLKIWLVVQLVCLVLNANQLSDKWVLILLFPLDIVYLLVVYSLFYIKPSKDEINTEDFEKYKKSFERNKKLEKLI